MANTVLGLASNQTIANSIVDRLNTLGFMQSDISVLYPAESGARDIGHEVNSKAPEGTAIGGATGGVVGGAIGLLAGLGLLAIPGLGPFIAAGPILAALSGIAAGAAAGGLAGGLVGLGIPEVEARQYESKLKEGNILVSVFARTGDELTRAKEAFEQSGATSITTTTAKDAPHASKPDVIVPSRSTVSTR